MTQKTLKLQQWTEKHDEFCLTHNLPPAAKLLWQWLMREGQLGEDIEPDLTEFNHWVTKHRGKGYCRLTLKNALAALVECRVVQIGRQFCWKIYRLVIRPLDWLKPKKNLHKRNQIYALPPSNPQSVEETDNSSSDSSNREEILEECRKEGVHYDPEKPAEIFNYSLNEVIAALVTFRARGGHEKILNPQGWLITCLRFRYWESYCPNLDLAIYRQ